MTNNMGGVTRNQAVWEGILIALMWRRELDFEVVDHVLNYPDFN